MPSGCQRPPATHSALVSRASDPGGAIRAFAKHPTAANLLMLGLIVMGVVALPKMQRETFPEFGAHKVRISIVYPGATADQVEEAICVRVEDAISGVGFVEEVVAEAREGVGQIVVEILEVVEPLEGHAHVAIDGDAADMVGRRDRRGRAALAALLVDLAP